MTKKFFLLVIVILLGGMTAVKAKINYVPLYIVDTHTDVKEVKHSPTMPLFITQDDHKLILPDIEDILTFMVYKDNDCVHQETYSNHSTIVLPSSLIGDYEVRLSGDDYYYYGYITLEDQNGGFPTENSNWDNITLLGSNTSQQEILHNIMGLNVVEYNMKANINEEDLIYLSEEDREAYIKQREEIHNQKRIGLLPEELESIFPQLVTHYPDGQFGINYLDLVPVLISCIQELKVQLDTRTEKIVDVMMARSSGTSSVSAVRAAIGNTLLSTAPSSVNEPARVRFVLTDNVTNAYIAISDMGGRILTKVPVSPSETDTYIDSGVLSEGIFLCTLFANGEAIGTKRLVKTK